MSSRLELIDQIIARGSTDPFVWYGRAMELRSLKRLKDSLSAFSHVHERFPEYVPTYLMAAQVAHELGYRGEALAWTQKGVTAARARGDHHAAQELESFASTLGTLEERS